MLPILSSRRRLCATLLLAAALAASSTAEARRPRPSRRPAPAQTPGKAAAPVRAEIVPEAGPAELLARARALYDALEYDRVIPFAEALLARAEADIEQRLDAYLLQGSCLAIIGDPVEAEKPFRFLLRGRPGFDLPPETAPKILAVFRKVQVEERAIVEQLRELERARLVKELELSGGVPEEAVGGRPLPFEFRLRDPRGVVAAVQLQYRRRGEPSFSSLALRRDESGAWRGALPGEWTASSTGFALEYFLTLPAITPTDNEHRSCGIPP